MQIGPCSSSQSDEVIVKTEADVGPEEGVSVGSGVAVLDVPVGDRVADRGREDVVCAGSVSKPPEQEIAANIIDDRAIYLIIVLVIWRPAIPDGNLAEPLGQFCSSASDCKGCQTYQAYSDPK